MSDYKEEYNFLAPISIIIRSCQLVQLSLLIAVFVYSAWYYSDRKTTNTVSTDDIKKKLKQQN